MNDRVTMHTGALGSVIHVLRADAETVAQLAAVDWNRHFRRVCLDPVRGVITLMAPSHLHEDLTRKVRFSRNLAERTEAVSRIVLRRQRAIVREEKEQYSASPGQPAPAADSRAH